MPRRLRTRSKHKRNKAITGNVNQNSDQSIQVYNGPVRLLGGAAQMRITRLNMVYETSVVSSAAGVYAGVEFFSSSFFDWTSVSSTWEEFRVLGFSISFLPSNRYTKITTNCVPGYVAIDRTTATVFSSRASAAGHESAKFHTLEDPWSKTVTMQNAVESQFQPTSSVIPTFWIKCYFDGLSVSTQYGYFFQVALLEFRGRF
jgi:hypothetical protein